MLTVPWLPGVSMITLKMSALTAEDICAKTAFDVQYPILKKNCI